MKTKRPTRTQTTYPLLSNRSKMSILQKIRGMWRKRKPDPIRQLRTLRQEWER